MKLINIINNENPILEKLSSKNNSSNNLVTIDLTKNKEIAFEKSFESKGFLSSNEIVVRNKLNNSSQLTKAEFCQVKRKDEIPKSIPIFGQEHKLVHNVRKLDQAIEITPGKIEILYLLDNPKDIIFVLTIYLQSLVEIEIRKYVEKIAKKFSIEYHKIFIKERESYWNTSWSHYSENKDLFFSWRLVFAPRYVMEYVIASELCWQIKENESRKFKGLTDSICSKSALAKDWLRKNGKKIDMVLVQKC